MWLVNVDRPSNGVIVDVSLNGVLTEGKIFSDVSGGVFLKFISFDPSSHSAIVGFSSNMFFVDMDFPQIVQSSSPVSGSVRIYDGNNNSVPFLNFTLSVDGKQNKFTTEKMDLQQ